MLADIAGVLNEKQVDDLVYNEKDETLHLSAKGNVVGSKVSVKEMLSDGIPVIDLNNGSGSDGDTDTDHNDGCDCGCEDNVVEFGDVVPTTPNEDNNVVEF